MCAFHEERAQASFGKPGGQRTAGLTGTDHDDIECLHSHSFQVGRRYRPFALWRIHMELISDVGVTTPPS
jgi:hypothetical protein